MRKALMGALVIAGTTILTGGALAQDQTDQMCRQQAARLALGGENLVDFMAYCNARQIAERPTTGDRWLACQDKTRGSSGRGADSSHTPQEKNAMRDCLESR